jgi:hypothetical protein
MVRGNSVAMLMTARAQLLTTKSVLKMHTLLDLRGTIPSFIHVSNYKQGDFNVLNVLMLEARAIYVMGLGLCGPRLTSCGASRTSPLHHTRKIGQLTHAYSVPVDRIDRSTGILYLSGRRTHRRHQPQGLTRTSVPHPLQGPRPDKAFIFLTNNLMLPVPPFAQANVLENGAVLFR